MTALIWLYLFVAGIISGLLSTMAGLASLVSYPVLLSIGLTPISANVTNTTSAVFTGIGSLFSSRTELSYRPRTALSIMFLTLIGGICGSFLLVLQPASTFEHVVPFLILIAGCLLLVPKNTSSRSELGTKQSRFKLVGKGLIIFMVGIYTGYFGASAGMILLSILTVTINQSFAVSNAIKNLSILSSNFVAMIVYSFTANINWVDALLMGLGFFIGGFLGPIFIRHIPLKPLQRLIAAGAFSLAGYFFYTTYFK